MGLGITRTGRRQARGGFARSEARGARWLVGKWVVGGVWC